MSQHAQPRFPGSSLVIVAFFNWHNSSSVLLPVKMFAALKILLVLEKRANFDC